MGTTTANKHGLRKAAEENRNRHAQRTPLPPKGGVKKVEVPEYAEQYGKMDAVQLRSALRNQFGMKPKAGLSVGQLLEMALRAERERRAGSETREDRIAVAQEKKRQRRAAENAAGLSQQTAVIDGLSQAQASIMSGSKSLGKAAPIREVMTQHGWSTTLIPAEGTETAEDVWELTGKRGDEVLWISWTKGVLTTEPMPSYTIADRTIKLRNASAVKQYAERHPEEGTKELARVSNNRFFRKRPTEPKRSRLPFDPSLATDEEVLSALVGHSVAWHNQYREIEESAIVGTRHGKQPVEIRPAEGGERVLWFCCPQTGFRAFRLSALTKVIGPSVRSKGKREVAS